MALLPLLIYLPPDLGGISELPCCGFPSHFVWLPLGYPSSHKAFEMLLDFLALAGALLGGQAP